MVNLLLWTCEIFLIPRERRCESRPNVSLAHYYLSYLTTALVPLFLSPLRPFPVVLKFVSWCTKATEPWNAAGFLFLCVLILHPILISFIPHIFNSSALFLFVKVKGSYVPFLQMTQFRYLGYCIFKCVKSLYFHGDCMGTAFYTRTFFHKSCILFCIILKYTYLW